MAERNEEHFLKFILSWSVNIFFKLYIWKAENNLYVHRIVIILKICKFLYYKIIYN